MGGPPGGGCQWRPERAASAITQIKNSFLSRRNVARFEFDFFRKIAENLNERKGEEFFETFQRCSYLFRDKCVDRERDDCDKSS